MSTPARDHSYHHGDLANTLLDDALEHISREGVQSLSLRALARKAGVSATAPYRHFNSKRSLLAALATRGFVQLEARMASARTQLPSASDNARALAEQNLMAVANAYVSFAMDNPTTYQLMFGSVLNDYSEYQMLERAAERSYAILNQVLADLQTAGISTALNVNLLGGTVWGGVHGIASLIIGDRASEAQLKGVDLNADGALQAIVALRENPDAALAALFAPLFGSLSAPLVAQEPATAS